MLYNQNVLTEPIYIQQLYTEYAKLINTYSNAKRPSAFARYYNINKNTSVIDKELESSYDIYTNNNIAFDLYEYTPLFYTSPIINDSTDSPDLIGKSFQGALTITLYTIQKPHINDLLIFPYNPTKGDEIFRVTNIRAVISGMNHVPEDSYVNWFELTLEYAPIETTYDLNIYKRFIYLLTEEKNIEISKYKILITQINKLEQLLKELEFYFDNKYEVYTYNNIIPINENITLYNYLAKNNFFKRYFNDIKIPYGIDRYISNAFIDISTQKPVSSNSVSYAIYNINTIIDYTYPIDVFNMNMLLNMFEEFRDGL